jgi:hypothetical protein
VRGGAVSEKTSLHSRLKRTVENKTPAFQQPSLLPRGICKPLYGIRNFYPLAIEKNFIVMIGKTPFLSEKTSLHSYLMSIVENKTF